MKQFGRVMSFLLSLTIIFSVFVQYGHAAYEVQYGFAAEALWEDGLFLGTGSSFDLDKSLTRAAGATMIVRLLGKEAEARSKAGGYDMPFTDVPEWAKPYVGYCYSNGISKGVSATSFGSNNDMSASQYITLVLRTLGYNDAAGDFSWDKAPAKALEIGLIGQSCYTQYTTTDLFLRDNAAVIAYNALSQKLKGTDAVLKSTIVLPGRPTGEMPAYTAGKAAENTAGNTTEKADGNVTRPGASAEENIKELMNVLRHIEGAMYLKTTKASSRSSDDGKTVTSTTYPNSSIDGLFSYGFKTACKFSSPRITSSDDGMVSDVMLTAADAVRSGDYDFNTDPVKLRVVYCANSLFLESDLPGLQKIFNNSSLNEQSIGMISDNVQSSGLSAIIYLPDSKGVLRGQYLLCNASYIGDYSAYRDISCNLICFNSEDKVWTFNDKQTIIFSSGSVKLAKAR